MTCPEHGVPYPCPVPISHHWHIEDGDDGRGPGWYVVAPAGFSAPGNPFGRYGPYRSEGDATTMLQALREP